MKGEAYPVTPEEIRVLKQMHTHIATSLADFWDNHTGLSDECVSQMTVFMLLRMAQLLASIQGVDEETFMNYSSRVLINLYEGIDVFTGKEE